MPDVRAALAALRDTRPAPPARLVAALDAERAKDSLQRAMPDLGLGARALVGCEVEGLRARRDGWKVRYALTLADAATGVVEQVRVVGVLPVAGAPQMTLRVDAVHELPALARLTDPGGARTLLERVLTLYAGRRVPVAGCDVDVARHVPGQRCTVLYRVRYDGAGEPGLPVVVVAKTYRGEEGADTYEVMRALWRSPLGGGPTPTIAEPLGYLADERALFQRGLPAEATLKDVVLDVLATGSVTAAAQVRMRAAARALAALHHSGVGTGRERVWEEEIGRLRAAAAGPGHLPVSLVAALGVLLDSLADRAGALPAEPALPAHGAFRPAQVLVHGADVAIVDFDGFCRTEPARDIARFRKALHKTGDAPGLLAALGESFLAAYEQAAPVSRARVALWECVAVLRAITRAYETGRPGAVPPLAVQLEPPLAVLRDAEV